MAGVTVRELVASLGFKVNNKGLDNFDAKISVIKKRINDVNKKFGQMSDKMANAGRKATLFLTVPILGLGVAAVKTANDFEQLDIAFTTMLGSAEKAQSFIEEMTDFAAKTPFTIKGVFTASKQLLAMGIEAEKIKPTLKALGDVSSGLSAPIGRIAFNFGQVRAAGRLTGREMRDFVNAGVPLFEELSKMLGKTTEEIKNMMAAGDITFDLVEKAFLSMSGEGGRFENLMFKQLKALGGILSNFLDVTIILAKVFGDMIVETFKLKEVFSKFTEILFKLMKIIKNLLPHQKKMLLGIMALLLVIGPLLLALSVLVKLFAFVKIGLIILKSAFFGAAGGAAVFNASILIIPILIIAVVAAIALLIDEIITWIKGGETFIGKLLGPWEKFHKKMLSIFDDIKVKMKNYFAGIMSGLSRTKSEMQPIFDWFKKEWELWVEFMSMDIPIPQFLKDFVRLLGSMAKGAGVLLGGGHSTSTTFASSGMTGIGATARNTLNRNNNVIVHNQNNVNITPGSNMDSVTTAKEIGSEINKQINENLERKFRQVSNLNPIFE